MSGEVKHEKNKIRGTKIRYNGKLSEKTLADINISLIRRLNARQKKKAQVERSDYSS